MKKICSVFLILVFLLSVTACNNSNSVIKNDITNVFEDAKESLENSPTISVIKDSLEEFANEHTNNSDSSNSVSIPEYSNEEIIVINNDEPFFTEEEKEYKGTYINLSELDELGRCGTAMSCVGLETEPTEEREDISHVHPSGWNQLQINKNKWLYNRSHLLMYALTGLNDDERNLITGTEYFNQELMLSYETTIKWVVDNYNAHVLYRVTPVYDGDNLVAKGVLMEAYCIEYPEECSFCVFVYNIEPGVDIDYATGIAQVV